MITRKIMLALVMDALSVCCALAADGFDWKAAVDGKITIPGGTTAVVTDEDVADVEGLVQINMGSYDSKIRFENNTVPLVLNAGILGGGGAGSGQRWLAMTADSRVTFNGAISPNNKSTYLDFGTCTINGIFNGYKYTAFFGLLEGATMTFGSTAQIKSSAESLNFSGLSSGAKKSPNGTIVFGCRVPESGTVDTVYFSYGSVRLATENALEGCGVLDFRTVGTTGFGDSGDCLSTLDLGGFPQRIGRVTVLGSAVNDYYKSTHYLEIRSDAPTTLTQKFDADPTEVYDEHMRFAGNVSFVYDAPCEVRLATAVKPAGRSEKPLNGFKSVSTTTGSLTVQRGKLVFPDGAAWQGAGGVTVKTGAILVFEGGSALTNEASIVTFETGSTVVVPAGEIITAKKFVIADRELTVPGEYGAEELALEGYEAVLQGGGRLCVAAQKGEFVWPEPGEQAVVPAGGVALVTDAEVERVNTVKGFTVLAGGKLVISNITEGCDVQVPIQGAGDILVVDSLNVVFSADNSQRRGAFSIVNSDVTCAHQQGWGSRTSPALTFLQGEQGAIRFAGDGHVCDSPIRILQDPHPFALAAADDETITFNGDFSLEKSDVLSTFGNVRFNGRFVKSGQMQGADFKIQSGHEVAFAAGGSFGFTMNLATESTVAFGDGAAYGIARFQSRSVLRADATNVLRSTATDPGWNGGCLQTATTATLDLNGFPQVVAQIQTEISGRSAASNSWMNVMSEAPAVLTYAPVSDSSSFRVNTELSVKFAGAVGLAYDGGSLSRTIVLHRQEATGPLEVKSGTLGFAWGAGWGGAEVKLTGGTLKVDEESAANMFLKTTNVVVGEGKLDLSGGTATVRSVKLPNGEFLPEGTYPAGSSLSFLTGSGTLRVLRSTSAPLGLLLIVR